MAKDALTPDQTKQVLRAGLALADLKELSAQGFGFEDLLEIADAQTAARHSGGLTKEALAELIEGQRKAVNPSNARHPQVSAFSHPLGDDAQPKGTLDRETYFLNAKQYEEQLTPAEIAAYNALTESKLIRKPEGDWSVEVTPKRRLVNVPAANLDQLMMLPNGLVLILKELADGSAAVDPVNMAKEIQALKDRLAAAGA